MRILMFVGLLTLTACGDQNSTLEPDKILEAARPDASSVAAALVAAGIPLAGMQTFTAETDPNKMLGRPGGYTSKVNFYDERHGSEDEMANESTIEVFANEDDAKAREEYVRSVTQGVPMLTQYLLRNDEILMRLDRTLTPAEVEAYEAVLAEF